MPLLAVVFTGRSAREIEAIKEWWRSNRQSAPDLFRQELEQRMALVASTPKLGIVVQNVRGGELLRTLLKRSGYHVYYRIDEGRSCIVVISVRHAQREPSRI